MAKQAKVDRIQKRSGGWRLDPILFYYSDRLNLLTKVLIGLTVALIILTASYI